MFVIKRIIDLLILFDKIIAKVLFSNVSIV